MNELMNHRQVATTHSVVAIYDATEATASVKICSLR